MKRLAKRLFPAVLLLGFAGSSFAQSVTVDVSPAKAIPFDPDQALGSSLDILPAKHFEKVFSPETIKQSLSAGWGPITYRQNTELSIGAWHWNPAGSWSEPEHKSGYFAGSADPAEDIRMSYGYPLPHRGNTRNGGASRGYSRLTDGGAATYWKSNPYLASKFTGESDSQHPQWIVVDFGTPQRVDAIQIAWADPYATRFLVQYWSGGESPMDRPLSGIWNTFPEGEIRDGKGGSGLVRLASQPVHARFLRILMTESSNTCDSHGSADPRNCVGYAAFEISAGNFSSDGKFIDLVKHVAGENQTVTLVSSIDPWHTESDRNPHSVQAGLDVFFKSGYTNRLPAMIPVSMLYGTPEDSAAELAYLRKRGYAVSYVEMGEEPDGQYMGPEDYGALFLEWAAALHKVDPALKLGGPVFEGVNEDIKVWPDASGKTSWLGRFVDYLRSRNRLGDLTFVSFEHYPISPCEVNWSDLYREPELTRNILRIWREDGVPLNVPLMNTESNLSWELTEPMQDVLAALWLADSVGSFLEFGGPGAVYYHSPIQPEPLRPGCRGYSTYGNFVADEDLNVKQYASQYFASRLVNLDWVRHGAGLHRFYPALSNVTDDAGNTLVTAYAAERPDGEWSLLIVNKDASNPHSVKIRFTGETSERRFDGTISFTTFGADQYVWHPAGAESRAEPDGPPAVSSLDAKADTRFTLPRASITVLRGKLR
ncbi:MAG TPA: discoidin domain-containing protein [Candidatus Acidoferrum sp.]|nr:discoidin domain-containing protein [Candidatus Acidoferrum sp.]